MKRSKGYNLSTPSNPLFQGPQGQANTLGGRRGLGPNYDEATAGLAPQDGGAMAEPVSGHQGLGVKFLEDGPINPGVVDVVATKDPKGGSPTPGRRTKAVG
jgi:hypothetical protein